MKLKTFSLAILIATGSLQAQMGIGTKTPESKLDINGDIKIGNEGKTNAQGKQGMIRWSEANTCFEGHNGKIWKCLDYKATIDYKKPLLHLQGGGLLRYNNEQGWKESDLLDNSTRNIVKLNIKGGTKQNLYDPQSGTIRVDEDGPYKLTYRIRLVNSPAEGVFDGTSGIFSTWVNINKGQGLINITKYVTRGIKTPNSVGFVDNTCDQIPYLKKDDEIHVRFNTQYTSSMSDNTNNIYINKDHSEIKLWKL